VVLPLLCHRETYELQEYHKNFFQHWDLSLFWHCAEAHYWCFFDFAWYVTVRLHTLGTMVPQFAYWSIGNFLHPCESQPHSLLHIGPESKRALPLLGRHCCIYDVEIQTCLQTWSLLSAYNTIYTTQCTHLKWLCEKFISKLTSLKYYEHIAFIKKVLQMGCQKVEWNPLEENFSV